ASPGGQRISPTRISPSLGRFARTPVAPPERELSRFAAARHTGGRTKRFHAPRLFGRAANRDGSRSASLFAAACLGHRLPLPLHGDLRRLIGRVVAEGLGGRTH